MSDVLVLGYHALSPRWTADLVVRPERFAEQIESLLARGYEATTFSRAVLAPGGRRALAVTFDDAFASVAALAAPILARLGAPATVFVPTARAGTGAPMAWPGIAQWRRSSALPREGLTGPASPAALRGLADGRDARRPEGQRPGARTTREAHEAARGQVAR